jgi:hypothetical protein
MMSAKQSSYLFLFKIIRLTDSFKYFSGIQVHLLDPKSAAAVWLGGKERDAIRNQSVNLENVESTADLLVTFRTLKMTGQIFYTERFAKINRDSRSYMRCPLCIYTNQFSKVLVHLWKVHYFAEREDVVKIKSVPLPEP